MNTVIHTLENATRNQLQAYIEYVEGKIDIDEIPLTYDQWLAIEIQNGSPISKDIEQGFSGGWSLADIKGRAIDNFGSEGELTDEQAREIANDIERSHDAELGINWNLIDRCIEDYFEGKSISQG